MTNDGQSAAMKIVERAVWAVIVLAISAMAILKDAPTTAEMHAEDTAVETRLQHQIDRQYDQLRLDLRSMSGKLDKLIQENGGSK